MSGLSEILLHDLRVLDSTTYLIEIAEGCSLNIVSGGRAVLHVVLAGTIEVGLVGGDAPVVLQAGDTATCFYGDHHRLAFTPNANVASLSLDCRASGGDEVERIRVPSDGGARERFTTVLTTIFSFAHVTPAAYSIRAGLSLWCMAGAREGGHGKALAIDTEQILEDCQGPGSRGVIEIFANLMLIRSIRDMHRSLWNDREMPVWAPSARRIASALLAIHAQPERDWTVAILARCVGLSRSCFASAFADEVGMTPIAYLNQVRMKRAAQLLQSERFAVADVSRRVGYRVPSSFTRAFTSYHGVSPSLFAQGAGLQLQIRQ
jgi:AraC-like DNA-binding protein